MRRQRDDESGGIETSEESRTNPERNKTTGTERHRQAGGGSGNGDGGSGILQAQVK